MSTRPRSKLAIAVAQLNSTVGDIAGNVEKVKRARSIAAGADMVVFPELFIAGYPPEDLVLKPAFQAGCRAAIEALARETAVAGPAARVGGAARRSKRLRAKRHRRVRRCWSGRHGLITTSFTTQWRCSTAAQSLQSATKSIFPTTVCSTKSVFSRRARCRGQ